MNDETLVEVNLDSLIGLGHHFGGLSPGNLASTTHKNELSNPQAAALQGLEKAWLLQTITSRQLLLPPLLRPHESLLQTAGFIGSYESAMARALEVEPDLVSAIWSSSFVWTANLGIFTPSCDSASGKSHLTLANLCTNLHRSLESGERFESLQKWLSGAINVHAPLPSSLSLADEGAANHTRFFSLTNPECGLHHFVYGLSPEGTPHSQKTSIYPARQSLRAAQWIARRHELIENHVMYTQQNPNVIDQGVFHNDVICTGHGSFLLCHEQAFVHGMNEVDLLRRRFQELTGDALCVELVSSQQLSVELAVKTYLFNSQLVLTPQGPVIIAALECERHPQTYTLLQDLKQRWSLAGLYFVDLTQSMHNGGGPACLRLRLPMKPSQYQKLSAFHLTPKRYQQLKTLIEKDYPTQLTKSMLIDKSYRDHAVAVQEKILQIFGLWKLA